MKREIRVLGLDDMPFFFSDETVDIVGVVMRGGMYLEGVLKATITVDGTDATDVISTMVTQSKHHKQLKAIMIDGAALGGFNIVDNHRIYENTSLPVLSITREKPDMSSIKKALQKHVDNWEQRWRILKATELIEIKGLHSIYVNAVGISPEESQELIRVCTVRGAIPEPIRVAHLIATGIKKGESRGRC